MIVSDRKYRRRYFHMYTFLLISGWLTRDGIVIMKKVSVTAEKRVSVYWKIHLHPHLWRLESVNYVMLSKSRSIMQDIKLISINNHIAALTSQKLTSYIGQFTYNMAVKNLTNKKPNWLHKNKIKKPCKQKANNAKKTTIAHQYIVTANLIFK